MSTGGLLAVHAHPDDETLSTGALLATFAAAGRPVTLVTCTRGERGEVIPADVAHLEGDGPALARHREGELAAAVRALGLQEQVFLDEVPLPAGASSTGPGAAPGPAPSTGPDGASGSVRFEDSGMAWLAPGLAGGRPDVPERAFVSASLDDAAARLAAVVSRRRPDVLVGYEPGGGYGHPDHVRAHQVLMRAVELLGARAPVVLWAAADARVLRQARAALPPPPPGMVNPSPDDPLPSVAVDSGVDLRVEVRPVADRVRAALSAHRTQVVLLDVESDLGPVLGAYALSNAVVQPLLAEECYRYAPGHASAGAQLDWPAGVGR